MPSCAKIPAAVKTRITIAAVLLTAGITGIAGKPPSADPRARALALCARIEKRFRSIKTLSYTAERTTVLPRTTVHDKWMMSYQAPDMFHIDYFQPYEKTIVVNHNGIWEYIPTLRKAVFTDLGALPPAEARRITARSLAPLHLEGFHVGDPDSIARRLVAVNDGAPPGKTLILALKDPTARIVLDTVHELPRSFEQRDSTDRITAAYAVQAFLPVSGYGYLPRRLVMRSLLKQRLVRQEILLKHLRLDQPLNPSIFRFHPPPAVQVITNNPHTAKNR